MLKPQVLGRRAAIALMILWPSFAFAQDFYWETPRALSEPSARYPIALEVSDGVAVVWQESRSAGGDTGEAYLSLALLRDGQPEILRKRFAGPFLFHGDEPPLLSAGVSPSGELAVCALSAAQEVTVLFSRDGGLSFPVSRVVRSDATIAAPRIFPRSGGGWYLFVAHGREESLTIYYSVTEDGNTWTPVSPFVNGGDNLPLSFSPTAASLAGSDVVVFQALSGAERPTFQLYSKRTSDGGLSWSPAQQVTSFEDSTAVTRRAPEAFENQRPFLASIGGKLLLVWERRQGSSPPQVYYAELNSSGAYLPGTAERVTLGSGTVGEPRLFNAGGAPGIVWFDNRRGRNRVYLAFREGLLWRERDITGSGQGDATFGRSVYHKGRLWGFWQSQPGSGPPSVIALEPDTSVKPPAPSAVDFAPGRRTRRDTVNLRWAAPEDSSGIAGFSYTWSRDPQASPPAALMVLQSANRATFTADEDGAWWFSIRAVDYAGNWSAPARIEFVRDTTPPGPPIPRAPSAGQDGFLASNTFSIQWAPPSDPDVVGYTWTLRYLGALDRPPARHRPAAQTEAAAPNADSIPAYSFDPVTEYERDLAARAGTVAPPPSSRGPAATASFSNVDDGYYMLAVAAIDEVGNIGPAARILLRADKFIPFTLVSDIVKTQDEFGRSHLRILGRGYREDGLISRVVLDKDGKEPFDYTFDRSAGGFSVDSDRSIGGLIAEDVEEGTYRVGLLHPVRGWYWTRSSLAFDASGTVKFGDYSAQYEPKWNFRPAPRYRVSFWNLFALLAVVFGIIGIIVTLRRAAVVLKDGQVIQMEVAALVEGGPMPLAKKKKAANKLKTRGFSLRFKFTAIIGVLVLFVTVMVAVPLGVFLVRTQGQNLARGLEQKTHVLLESVAQGAKTYLPAENILELGFLPQQVQALEEAKYVTITGYGARGAAGGSTNPDIVWASNDPDILGKLDSLEFRPGQSVLSDELSSRIPAIAEAVDKRANEEVGSIAETLAQLTAEAQSLAVHITPENEARLSRIAATTRDLEKTLNERLQVISQDVMSSEPLFNPTNLDAEHTSYIFYKPIVFRQGQDGIYYRGMVRLEVSTDLITRELRNATTNLVRITGALALLVLAIGVIGAAILSYIIVSPIRKLVKAIEKIRDTEDKEELAEERIELKSRDELYHLADAVNTLTEGLVKAAKTSKDLTVGKETQKMFLPLEKNSRGDKLTTGHEDTPEVSFFGYYEGAKGVSGDYFDFRKLDDRYYAFIKCDAAGKGIPASIISVEVATLFLNHFTGWTFKERGIKLDSLCYQINDLVEGRGFRGRFAALTVGVLDGKTGTTYLCNAGDKLLRVYEARSHKVTVHELPDSPTAGTFPNFMVEMKSPYVQVAKKLEKGDILLLYTDGIEESTRYQRDTDFRYIEKSVPLADGSTQTQRQTEHFENERVHAIVEAVLTKGRFRLEKIGNPVPDELLSFDYSSCEGTLEEVVLALISAEKLFRLYPDPNAVEKNAVLVDAKIDAFLEKHFEQYRVYLKGKRRDNPDAGHPEYVTYVEIAEDEQYDDLTLMAIQRK